MLCAQDVMPQQGRTRLIGLQYLLLRDPHTAAANAVQLSRHAMSATVPAEHYSHTFQLSRLRHAKPLISSCRLWWQLRG